MRDVWSVDTAEDRWCVLTGGEPALQVDSELIDALHEDGWSVAVETNGTVESDAIHRCDHVCVSPKRGTPWHCLGVAHEIKVILPGAATGEVGWTDAELEALEAYALSLGTHAQLFVQPQDPIIGSDVLEQTLLKHNGSDLSAARKENLVAEYRAHLDRCIAWVQRHSRWRLSVQLHKYIGVA
jgi:organic radical activating enzyme